MAETLVASVVKAKLSKNGLVVTVRDNLGREKDLNLSPGAQSQFLQALLVGPPMSVGREGPRGPLIAQNVRLAELPDGETVLEVTIGPQMTVHILLPRPVLHGLQKLLTDWASKTH